MITISQTLLSELQAHGVREFPHECCGAMLGEQTLNSETGDLTKQIIELIPIDNHWTVSDDDGFDKRRRFAIRPEDYQAVEKAAKAKNLTLLGFYHSHPDHPAIPSATDLKFAWPNFSYIIQSIITKVPAEIHSYVLDLDAGQFKPEGLEIYA
jgi:proteasome lid subunit RPN8/RPN11